MKLRLWLIVMVVGLLVSLAGPVAMTATNDEIGYLDIVQITNGFFAGYEGQVINSDGASYTVAIKVADPEFGSRQHDYHMKYENVMASNLKLVQKAKRIP